MTRSSISRIPWAPAYSEAMTTRAVYFITFENFESRFVEVKETKAKLKTIAQNVKAIEIDLQNAILNFERVQKIIYLKGVEQSKPKLLESSI